jgi:preprotein translocase subunit SecY
VQGYGVAVSLENSQGIVLEAGFYFRLVTTITLLTGTMLLMWLGEQITARGIGNGISLIIFAGIVAEIPGALASTFELGRTGAISAGVILVIITILIGAIYFIVFVERAQRKILIHYPKRQVGNKLYGGDASHLPLKVNTAGVIPAIFASALLILPITISNFTSSSNEIVVGITSMLGQGKPLYMIIYAAGIIFFSFFYTSIIFNPKETAENLRKYGGFVPGIRPGEQTEQFIDQLLLKLTAIGSLYLVLICLLPELIIANYPIPFYLGGTSLLIVAVVAMDTVAQVQTRLMSQQYESLIKKTKFNR